MQGLAEQECTLLLNTAPILKELLVAFEMPLTRHEISKECLRRSKRLISDLSTSAGSKVASVMASAMSPESKILNEPSVYSKIREVHDKHQKLYDVLKEQEHKRLQKFLQVCEEEKKAFVSETLHRKAQLMTRLDRAKIGTKDRLSSQDILPRMVQNVEEVVRKVDIKRKNNIERVPNSECAVCFTNFNLKRKRACINPCGHASTCFDCAGREYKRTKTCPICMCRMDQFPVALPGELYY